MDGVLEEHDVAVLERSGIYAPDSITLFEVQWLDGTISDLYGRSQGHPEGYTFDIYDSKEAALAMGIGDDAPMTFSHDPGLGWRKD